MSGAWNRPRAAAVPGHVNVSKAYRRCDLCQRRVFARDWDLHQGSPQCVSAQTHEAYEARGWREVKAAWGDVIRNAGLPIERGPGGYRVHGPAMPGREAPTQSLFDVDFAPVAAVHACFLLANYKMTAEARARCVRMVHDDPEIYQAADTVYRTHGQVDARRYLLRMMRLQDDAAEQALEQANAGGYRG